MTIPLDPATASSETLSSSAASKANAKSLTIDSSLQRFSRPNIHLSNGTDNHASSSSGSTSLAASRRESLATSATHTSDYGNEIDEEMEMQEADRLIRDVEAKEAASVMDQTRAGGERGKGEGSGKLPAWVIIPVWISLSGGVILFNKHIFSDLDFPFPVFMTFYHMIVATIGTRILQRLPFERLRPKPINMDWLLFSQTILPLSALFSASLILSNMAYVHLSVSFVQMLKAFIPILTLVIQLICGLQEYSTFLLSIVALTASGCIIAAAGELRFSLFGFLCQVSAVVVESTRLVLMQVILRNYKLDPLSSIAMYAPVCVVLIGICLPFMEGTAPFENLYKVGWGLLLANGVLAFMLNVVGMFLIDSAGSLVLTLSGVLKDVLLISVAWLMGSFITMIQVLGYSIALSGLLLFKMTGGSPTSPAGQQVMQVVHAITDAPRHYLRIPRFNTRITMTVVAVFMMVGVASLYLAHHPEHRHRLHRPWGAQYAVAEGVERPYR